VTQPATIREKFGSAQAADPASRRGLDSKMASLPISLSMWDAFLKEAGMTSPAIKAFKTNASSGLKNLPSPIPGKDTSLAGSSGKGQTAVLGRTGTSALATPPPPIRTV
jgi:hypothetical protein